MKYKNRKDAGEKLAKILSKSEYNNPVILAMARGGVPVAHEISTSLNIPMHVLIVRKIGAPESPELGVGAIAEGDYMFIDYETVDYLDISDSELSKVINSERKELNRRTTLYRQNKPLPRLKDKTVIIVDDGLATGVTARAAINLVKTHDPKKIVIASPICAYNTSTSLQDEVDEVVCGITPYDMRAIGHYYSNFDEVTDEELLSYLK